MPQHYRVHRQYPLDTFYPNFFSAGQAMVKYWVATSSDDIYDTKEINDSGWSLIELPFESKAVWLGNRLLLFHTTQNLLVLNRHVALKVLHSFKVFHMPFEKDQLSSSACPFYIFDIRKLVDVGFDVSGTDPDLKCYDIHRVVCDSSCFYFEMINGILIVLKSDEGKLSIDTRFVKDRIKLIETSLQSSKMVVYTEGHKLYFDSENVPIDHIDSPFRLIAASPVSVALVTEDNRFYLNGDDSNGTCGGIQTGGNELKLALKQFSPSERIANIKCGYIHTVILLENGHVWASGYNDLKQCGIEGPVKEFTEIEERYYQYGHFRKIRTTSRGTVLMSDSGAVFIGEVVHKFKQYKDRYLFEPFTPDFNEVAGGGWQYVLFKKNETTKSLNYFLSNLKQFARGESKQGNSGDVFFQDCQLIIQ